MGTLLYIVVLGCLGVVLFWYISNEATGKGGEAGWLALRPAMDGRTPANGRRYRERKRRSGARPEQNTGIVDPAAARPSARETLLEAAAPRRYLATSDALRYRKLTRGAPASEPLSRHPHLADRDDDADHPVFP